MLAGALVALGVNAAAHARDRHGEVREPIVIGHRGASGYVPEHTLAAYYLAILQGADFVEPDLVITKDGVLVARHENEIGGTTDVSQKPEFADHRTTKTIDGVAVTGWFTEDFTLAELKTLRAKERIPQVRPGNTRFDGMFEVPTFEEVLALVESVNEQRRKLARGKEKRHVKPIGVYPETKHPTFFQQLGLPLEEPLLRLLRRYGYNDAHEAVFIQSFEVANLQKLSRMTKMPLVQLINDTGKPWDFVVGNDPRTYADLVKPENHLHYRSMTVPHPDAGIVAPGGRELPPRKPHIAPRADPLYEVVQQDRTAVGAGFVDLPVAPPRPHRAGRSEEKRVHEPARSLHL